MLIFSSICVGDFLVCGRGIGKLVLPPYLFKIVVRVKVLGPQHVSNLWLG